tara:strand:- start:387 stop:1247 length:861 start_codon:yes stop_codon:yes gene_type:complete
MYKIQHLDKPELIYIGHTTNFVQRKYHHKWRCETVDNEKFHLQIYQIIRDNGGWDAFSMVVIKEFPCDNYLQARTEEDLILREYKMNMNTIRPVLDVEQEHKQKIIQNKNYRDVPENKEKHQAYYKEWLKTQPKPKMIDCICGSSYRGTDNYTIKKHEKTPKHINALNPVEPKKPTEKTPEQKSQIKNKTKEWNENRTITVKCKCEVTYKQNKQTQINHELTQTHINFINNVIQTEKTPKQKKTSEYRTTNTITIECKCGVTYKALNKSIIIKHELTKNHINAINI